jgi:hypothetical protein
MRLWYKTLRNPHIAEAKNKVKRTLVIQFANRAKLSEFILDLVDAGASIIPLAIHCPASNGAWKVVLLGSEFAM